MGPTSVFFSGAVRFFGLPGGTRLNRANTPTLGPWLCRGATTPLGPCHQGATAAGGCPAGADHAPKSRPGAGTTLSTPLAVGDLKPGRCHGHWLKSCSLWWKPLGARTCNTTNTAFRGWAAPTRTAGATWWWSVWSVRIFEGDSRLCAPLQKGIDIPNFEIRFRQLWIFTAIRRIPHTRPLFPRWPMRKPSLGNEMKPGRARKRVLD